MKKLLAFDLDDTLLNDDKIITQLTLDTLKDLKKDNIYAINSVRNQKRCINFARQIGAEYIVCFGGNVIIEVDKDIEIINRLEKEDVLRVIEIAEEYNLGKLVASEFLENTYSTNREYAVSHNQLFGDKNDISSTYSFKVVFEMNKNWTIEEIIKIYDKFNYACFESSDGGFFRVMPQNTDKWVGLKRLIERLNIDIKDVIDFGDSVVDKISLENVGVGVKMLNSIPEIKNNMNIKYSTEYSNNEDGIAKFLIEYFKGE